MASPNVDTQLKTVLVLGASYAGHRAAQLLAQNVPKGWRVVVIERNTHFNHLYAFPRVAVLPGHEHKTFIPYTNIFTSAEGCNKTRPPQETPCPHRLIHAVVTSLTPHSVTYTPLATNKEESLSFHYLIYALGSYLPAPINVWATETSDSNCPVAPSLAAALSSASTPMGTKPEGTKFMRRQQEQIKSASSVLVIGGGPLGVQYASDIKDLYPTKEVTLVHSRDQLLPKFDEYLHYEAMKKLEEIGVRVILNSRVDLSAVQAGSVSKSRVLQVSNGQSVPAEVVLVCTGQTPNTSFIKSFAPESINPLNGATYVTRTMQLANPPALPSLPSSPTPSFDPERSPSPSPPPSEVDSDDDDSFEGPEDVPDVPVPTISSYPHIFVVGDASDAFGALKAGHTAWGQAEVAAHNVISLIQQEEGMVSDVEMREYFAPPFLIKVSLGLKSAIFQSRDLCGIKGEEECKDEALNSHIMWTRRGLSTDDMTI